MLLDSMMPEMDGFQLCRKLEGAEQAAGTPVIFVTAVVNPEDEARGLECGGGDYITWPVSPPVVAPCCSKGR